MFNKSYKGWSATYDSSRKKWSGRKSGKPKVCACDFTKLQKKIDAQESKTTKAGGVHYF